MPAKNFLITATLAAIACLGLGSVNASAQEMSATTSAPPVNPSATVVVRGLVPIGQGELPYFRIAIEQIGLYGTSDPIHLHPTVIGFELPVLRHPVSFVQAFELSVLGGVLWEPGVGILISRQVGVYKFRQDFGSFFGHGITIFEEALALAPSGVAAAPMWGAALFNMYRGAFYAGVRASGDATKPGSGKAGLAFALKLNPSTWNEIFLLPSYEYGNGGTHNVNLLALVRFGRATNHVEPMHDATAPILQGLAPLQLLPGQVEMVTKTAEGAKKAVEDLGVKVDATGKVVEALAGQAVTAANAASAQNRAFGTALYAVQQQLNAIVTQIDTLAARRSSSRRHR